MWKINQATKAAKRLEHVGLEIVMMPMVRAWAWIVRCCEEKDDKKLMDTSVPDTTWQKPFKSLLLTRKSLSGSGGKNN